MNFNALMKLLAFHLVNQEDGGSNAPARINHSIPSRVDPLPIFENKKDDLADQTTITIIETNDDTDDSNQDVYTYMPPYDCSMPYPPILTTEAPPVNEEPKELQVFEAKPKDEALSSIHVPDRELSQPLLSKIESEVEQKDVQPRAKASIRIPINIKHIPDSEASPSVKQEVQSDAEQKDVRHEEQKEQVPHVDVSIPSKEIPETSSPQSEPKEIAAQKADQPIEKHPKASIQIPLHIVHKLPDAVVLDLLRFENYCEEKIHDVYMAIKEFNDFNYDKIQEINYLSYNDKRKSEILDQSNEKKEYIKFTYVKMHRVCNRAETERDRITTVLNPFIERSKEFYAQPARVPKCWYDMHNLEVIIMQLFTPKMTVKTYFDENAHVLRMRPRSTLDLTRKQFIKLPDEFISSVKHTNADETIDGSSLIMEENHPKTAVELLTKDNIDNKINNILEPFTYSTCPDIQQIIVHYEFKYWEHEVHDLTQKVLHFSKLLEIKKRSNADEKAISQLKDKLTDAVAELQSATMEMERNREIPEIDDVYNAENIAHALLPNIKFTTKLIGDKNKRIVSIFNPNDSIMLNRLTDATSKMDIAKAGEQEDKSERSDLPKSLQWDRNWEWDY